MLNIEYLHAQHIYQAPIKSKICDSFFLKCCAKLWKVLRSSALNSVVDRFWFMSSFSNLLLFAICIQNLHFNSFNTVFCKYCSKSSIRYLVFSSYVTNSSFDRLFLMWININLSMIEIERKMEIGRESFATESIVKPNSMKYSCV